MLPRFFLPLPNHLSQSEFRTDINALRAFAVVVVVLFHFHIPGFAGGFIGVDVFFVISGFLMTRIIYRGLNDGTFSLRRFYRARFFRIVPAYVVMVLVVLWIAAVLVDPQTGEKIAKNAGAAALFASNLKFAREGSYFADAAESNWLLHSWSLAVEWQFYLIFPVVVVLLLLVVRNFSLHFTLLSVAFLLSLGLAIFASLMGQGMARHGFFQLPMRGWELLAGGLVALSSPLTSERIKMLTLVLGLGMIAASLVILDRHSLWPSIWTVLPALGTALVLFARVDLPMIFDASITRYLGLRSYSIYLWHWPIVVGIGYWSGVSMWLVLIGLLLSIGVAELSYQLVEKRAGEWLRTLSAVPLSVAVFAAFLVPFGVAKMVENQAARRLDTAINAHPDRDSLRDLADARGDWLGYRACPEAQFSGPYWTDVNRCGLVGAGQGRVAVVGDSYAEQFLPRLVSQGDRYARLDLLYTPGCPPFLGLDRRAEVYRCPRANRELYQHLQTGNYDRIVVISAVGLYFKTAANGAVSCFEVAQGRCLPLDQLDAARLEQAASTAGEALAILHETGADVALVGPMPSSAESASGWLRSGLAGSSLLTRQPPDEHRSVRSYLEAVAGHARATIFIPQEHLCTPDCPLVVDGSFLYKDDDHFRASLVSEPWFAWIDEAIYGR